MCYFASYRLLAEFSTPFLNLVFISEYIPQLQKPPRLFHHRSVLAFSLAFFACRFFPAPLFWREIISADSYGRTQIPIMWYTNISVCALIDIMNIFWAFKIVKKCYRSIVHLRSLSVEQKSISNKLE